MTLTKKFTNVVLNHVYIKKSIPFHHKMGYEIRSNITSWEKLLKNDLPKLYSQTMFKINADLV